MNYTESAKKNNINASRLTGFDIQDAFKALSLKFPCARIFSESSNIAGSTDEYLINRSQSQLAEIANVSLRTAARHCKEAQLLNMIDVIPVFDKNTRARLANVYKLTDTFLRFARDLRDAVKPKKISLGNHVKAFKEVVDKLLIRIKFRPTPPMPNVHTPPCQNGTANNKYNSLEVRETETGAAQQSENVKDEVDETTEQSLVSTKAPLDNQTLMARLAKGSAEQANFRNQNARKQQREQDASMKEKALKLAKRMNWFSKPTDNRRKNDDAFSADFSTKNYHVPAGFRGA